jgi:hypothetical protein
LPCHSVKSEYVAIGIVEIHLPAGEDAGHAVFLVDDLNAVLLQNRLGAVASGSTANA